MIPFVSRIAARVSRMVRGLVRLPYWTFMLRRECRMTGCTGFHPTLGPAADTGTMDGRADIKRAITLAIRGMAKAGHMRKPNTNLSRGEPAAGSP